MTSASRFLNARDYLLTHYDDYEQVRQHFSWPALDRFNWALDYFDVMAANNLDPPLLIVDENGNETKRPLPISPTGPTRWLTFFESSGPIGAIICW